ncbi:MAG: tetratricopeptide repeat protein [Nitrospirae bacterium]|nr:tetratricopeptide repeat protein [Nitrospirota bacterium]
MSYRIKIVSKETPADEAHLLSGMERFLLRAQQHRRGLLVGFFTLLAAAVGVGGVVWYDHRQAEQALELNRQATRLYLDRPADQLAKADEHLTQAIGLYRQVVDRYPRTPTAPLSLFQLGNALVQANDLGGAIEAYRKYVATYGANKTMLGLVYQRLGYAYLLNGDHNQAVKAFSAVLDIPGTINKDQALFELGKLEETQSRPEGALARYQELMKNYPNSPFASEAAFRIKALEVKMTPAEGKTPSSGEPGKEGGKEGEK